MSKDDFGGVEFALGSVVGVRSWKISEKGLLEPVSHRGAWSSGENVAECYANHPEKKREDEEWSDYSKRTNEWRDGGHSLNDCAHGFYAYFGDKDGGHYSGSPELRGVVEGYGEVVIGTKGFRAAKARILALSIEPFEGMWELDPFYVARLKRNYPGVAFLDSMAAVQMEFPTSAAREFAELAA